MRLLSTTKWIRALLGVLAVVVVALAVRFVSNRLGRDRNGTESRAAEKQPRTSILPALPQPPPSPPEKSLPVTEEDQAAFLSLADGEFTQLHHGITLAQWTDLRGKSEGWGTKSETFPECRTLMKTDVLPSGRQMIRTAYFVPPSPPTPASPPTSTGEELIESSCSLSVVQVQTSGVSTDDGHNLEQALEHHFTAKYGSGIGTKGTEYEYTKEAGRWKAGSVHVISVFDPTHAADAPNDDTADSVFAAARLTATSETDSNDGYGMMRAYRYRSIEQAQFHRAIAIASADAGLTESVSELYDGLFNASRSSERAKLPESTKLRDSVVPLLRIWIDATKGLQPSRRAASLYVAHRLLSAAEDVSMISGGWNELWGKDKTELRSVLGKLGAKYTYAELGGIYEYSNNWLEEARELDPNGPGGEMAVLDALARGRAPQIEKDQQVDIFHAVIVDGEWLLARNPDEAIVPQLHFIIGDAYADMVVLAEGGEPDYGESFTKEEGDAARKKALEHYRLGLALDGTSQNAKDAWLQAWHLSAGLMPTTRYVYIDD